MNPTNIVEYLVINCFWIYVLVRFVNVFLNKKKSTKIKRILVYILFYSSNSLAYLLIKSPFINILTSVIGIFTITLCYQSTLIKRLTTTILIYAVCMICDIAIAILLSNYVIGMTLDTMNNILTYLMIFIIELSIEYCFRLKSDNDLLKGYSLTVLLIPGSSMVIICLLVFMLKEQQVITFIVVMLLLLMNIAIFFLYDLMIKNSEDKYNNIILEQQLSVYRYQLDMISQSENSIAALKHDMKHHLMTLKNMIESSTEQNYYKYLQDIIGAVDHIKEFSRTGDKDIDSILNYFMQRAVNIGIKLDENIEIYEIPEIHFFDLNIILSNLLDNAITASITSVEKKMSFKMKLEKNILYINITNSYNNPLKVINGKLLTSKQGEGHGYGLKNIETIVEKYDGLLTIKHDNNVFSVTVLLYNKK